jgi:hypothetical protein
MGFHLSIDYTGLFSPAPTLSSFRKLSVSAVYRSTCDYCMMGRKRGGPPLRKELDNNEDQNSRLEFAADTKRSPQFSDLQTQEDCNRYREKDDEMKSPDQ